MLLFDADQTHDWAPPKDWGVGMKATREVPWILQMLKSPECVPCFQAFKGAYYCICVVGRIYTRVAISCSFHDIKGAGHHNMVPRAKLESTRWRVGESLGPPEVY